MNRKIGTFFATIFFFIIFPLIANALEKTTHETLNYQITLKTNLNDYLFNQLDFSKGAYEKFKGNSAIDWITLGGIQEDEPIYTRSFNHYLNPITNTGYSGTFKSALAWAQDQGTFGSLFGGNYSWKAVREYYFVALTGRDFSGAVVAADQNTRGIYFFFQQRITLIVGDS